MKSRLRRLNLISAVSFLISSGSLFCIPFIGTADELPAAAYAVAAVFWAGLMAGGVIQVYIGAKCRAMCLKNTKKAHRLPLIITAAAAVVLMIMIITRSRSSAAVIAVLSAVLLSAQASVILKRKECLDER